MIQKEKIKTIAVIVTIVTLFVISGYFVLNKLLLTIRSKDGSSTKLVPSLSNQVNVTEVNENSTTTAMFIGYYTTSQKLLAEGSESDTCSAFVTYKSENPLFLYFSKLVQEGNTVNSFDKDNNLILKIDFDHIATETQQKITTSTKENPITLLVQKHAFLGKDAGPCTSFVNILSIQQ